MSRLTNRFLWIVLLLSARVVASSDAVPVRFDGHWRLSDGLVVVTELQGPVKNAVEAMGVHKPEKRFGGDLLSVRWKLDYGKWFARANYGRMEDTILAGSEYKNQVGNDQSQFVVGRFWHGGDSDWWTRKTLQTSYEVSHRNDGQTLADRYSAEFGMVGPRETTLQLKYLSGREFQAGQLIDFDRLVFSGHIRPMAQIKVGVETHVGDRMDFVNARLAQQHRVTPFIDWTVRDDVSLRLDSTHVDLDATDGQSILDANLVDAQRNWQLEEHGTIFIALQQQDIVRNPQAYSVSVDARTKELGRKLAYSWSLNPRTQIQLGYADAFADANSIEALMQSNSNWFMNVGYTLGL